MCLLFYGKRTYGFFGQLSTVGCLDLSGLLEASTLAYLYCSGEAGCTGVRRFGSRLCLRTAEPWAGPFIFPTFIASSVEWKWCEQRRVPCRVVRTGLAMGTLAVHRQPLSDSVPSDWGELLSRYKNWPWESCPCLCSAAGVEVNTFHCSKARPMGETFCSGFNLLENIFFSPEILVYSTLMWYYSSFFFLCFS